MAIKTHLRKPLLDLKKQIFKPHSLKQQEAIFSAKTVTLCCTGIQYGKTTIGAYRMKIAMCRFRDKLDNFIIAAPNYKIMHQSTLPAFLTLMDGLGHHDKKEATFKLKDGGTCYLRTGTQPDSVVGITNVRHIWLDEGGKVSLYFWENLQARASFKKAKIDITTSPYAINWVYKDLIKPFKKGYIDYLHLLQARSDENPYFPKEEFESKKASMHPKRFNAIYGGEFEKMEGLVYDCFDEEENICEPFKLPPGTRYYGSLDWGFTHPTSFLVLAITPEGDRYIVFEWHKTQKTINDIIDTVSEQYRLFGIKTVYCDPAQPGYIEELNRAGIIAIASKNDVRPGIDLVYSYFKTRRLKIFRGAASHLVDELSSYHWHEPEEINPNKDLKDKNPVKQNDDGCDSLRYLIVSTHFDTAAPFAPTDKKKKRSEEEIFKELTRTLNEEPQFEEWTHDDKAY